ncbi:MAG: DMT family transporter [Chitinophagaceae bacterium]
MAILGTLLFSTKAIWIKLCFRESNINATTLLMLRMLLSLPFYLIIFWSIQRNGKVAQASKKTYLWAIAMGILGYYLSSLFDFIGLQYVSAGIERIILFIYPTLAVLINYWIFKVPIMQKQWWAILVTYLGIGVAYWSEINQFQQTELFIFGSIMVLLCGITYAMYLVGTGKLIPKLGATQYTSIAMLSASAGIFTHYCITESIKEIPSYLDPQHPIFFYVLGLALFATVIPSFLLSTGMKRIGSNDLAIVTSIGPVATLFQARYLLEEPFSLLQILGTVLVIIGVLMVKKSD